MTPGTRIRVVADHPTDLPEDRCAGETGTLLSQDAFERSCGWYPVALDSGRPGPFGLPWLLTLDEFEEIN